MKPYGDFQTIAAARKAYSRCRNVQFFILRASNRMPDCACCGRPVNDFTGLDNYGKALHPSGYQSNRCEYHPRTKRVIAMHYVCAWTGTLNKIAQMRLP